jgi:hypothetical protein
VQLLPKMFGDKFVNFPILARDELAHRFSNPVQHKTSKSA